jgi:hypothetical protein
VEGNGKGKATFMEVSVGDGFCSTIPPNSPCQRENAPRQQNVGRKPAPAMHTKKRDSPMTELATYNGLLAEIKNRIAQAQMRALLAANAEMIQLYWQVGRLLSERQFQEGAKRLSSAWRKTLETNCLR